VLGRVPGPFAQRVQAPEVALDPGGQDGAVHAFAGRELHARRAIEQSAPFVEEGAPALALGGAGQGHFAGEFEAPGRHGGVRIELPQLFDETLARRADEGPLREGRQRKT
jgi:hypothetical protein